MTIFTVVVVIMFEKSLTPKKIEILTIAEELFSIKGVDNTSVRDICNAAKINVAMIKYYFGSKDQLVATLFKWRILKMTKELAFYINNSEMNAFEKLLGFLQFYSDKIFSNHEFHKLMLREYSKNKPEIFDDSEIRELKSRNVKFLQDTIREGYEEGLFGRMVPAETISFTIIGAASYSILNQKTYMPLLNIEDPIAYKEYIDKEIFPYYVDIVKMLLDYREPQTVDSTVEDSMAITN